MNSSLQRLTAIAVAISVAACSIIDPIVMKEPKLDIDGTQPLFKAQSAIAFDLYHDYRIGRRDMGRYSFFTGLALTGLGLAGLGVALFQAPNNALFGVSFAAAGVAGVRAFVPFDARRQIYAGGQKAIVCSVSALSLGGVQAQPKDPENSVNPTKKNQALSYEEGLDGVIDKLEKLQFNPLAQGEQSGNGAGKSNALLKVAGRDTAVAFRAGALETSMASLLEWLKIFKALASPSLSDAERARVLQIALIAIDLAVQDQLDRADVDPDKALKVSGTTVGPWIKNFVDTTIAARSEARRVGNYANKVKSALEDSGVRDRASPAQVEKAKKFVDEVKESANKADAILQQIWSLTRLPSECYNGFAGGVQQSGEPVPEGS